MDFFAQAVCPLVGGTLQYAAERYFEAGEGTKAV
jgi:hypothetical protein